MEHLPLIGSMLGMFVALCGWVRFDNNRQAKLIKAEVAVTMAEHLAECPARARAISNEDDSGEVALVDAKGEPSARWHR